MLTEPYADKKYNTNGQKILRGISTINFMQANYNEAVE